MKRSFADILGGIDAEKERRTDRKLPAWAAASASRKAAGLEPLEIPSALTLEQCSSEETALFKRSLLEGLFPGGIGTLCDLTCGLGIDSLAFSAIARQVISYERSPELAQAAARNFKRLGVSNIEVRSEEVGPLTELPECDVIFADPARRDGAGRKVFRLEDCSPDIRPLLPTLLTKAGTVLLKLSPMADISLVAGDLGESLEQVHVISLHSEVKELLCLLRRGHTGTYTITARELGAEGAFSFEASSPATASFSTSSTASFSFTPEEEREAEAAYCPEPQPGQLLLEPRAALMKSGAYKLICSRFGLAKLAPSTHLYIGKAATASMPDATGDWAPFDKEKVMSGFRSGRDSGTGRPTRTADFQFGRDSGTGATADTGMADPGLSGVPESLFKIFRINEVHPFNGQTVKALGKLYPDAEVSARNLPLSSDELRRRMGVRGGCTRHIFGCSTSAGKLLIVAETLR